MLCLLLLTPARDAFPSPFFPVLFCYRSRPASGERYLVCVGLLPPTLPTGCRFTDGLRDKVHALQRHSGCGSPAADPGAREEFSTFKPRGSGSGSGGIACNAVADRAGALDAALEMKADVGFLSFLRRVSRVGIGNCSSRH